MNEKYVIDLASKLVQYFRALEAEQGERWAIECSLAEDFLSLTRLERAKWRPGSVNLLARLRENQRGGTAIHELELALEWVISHSPEAADAG